MELIELPGGETYTSWIKLEEQAEALLAELTQHTQTLVIDDRKNVYANSVVIFDTGPLDRRCIDSDK